jgi:hypothetical protein
MSEQPQQCSELVRDENRWFSLHQCSRKGTLTHNGKLYCKQHYPPNVEKKDAEREARWARESELLILKRKILSRGEDVIRVAKFWKGREPLYKDQALRDLEKAIERMEKLEVQRDELKKAKD